MEGMTLGLNRGDAEGTDNAERVFICEDASQPSDWRGKSRSTDANGDWLLGIR